MKILTSRISRLGSYALFSALLFTAGSAAAFGQKECKASGYLNDSNSKPVLDAPGTNCRKAEDAFISAIVIVIGQKIQAKDLISLINAGVKGNYGPAFQAKYDAGLKFTDAVDFLKTALLKDPVLQAGAISNAFYSVYGANPQAADKANWTPQIKSGKAWYATIVSSENTRLNKTSTLRTAMIKSAYQNSFAREPTATEYSYWSPKKENYDQMIEKNRCWLYSPSGETDLLNATKKWLSQPNATDAKIKSYMKSRYAMHRVYIEMINEEPLTPGSGISVTIHHALMCGN